MYGHHKKIFSGFYVNIQKLRLLTIYPVIKKYVDALFFSDLEFPHDTLNMLNNQDVRIVLSYISGYIMIVCKKLYGTTDITKWTSESICHNLCSQKIKNSNHDKETENIVTHEKNMRISCHITRVSAKKKSIILDVICLHRMVTPFIQLFKLFGDVTFFCRWNYTKYTSYGTMFR